jgi:hypothetical protein
MKANQTHNFYTVCVRTFVIPFYSGSGTIINYGSDSLGSVSKLRFRFRYCKKLRFLRFRFRYLSEVDSCLQLACPKQKDSFFWN